MKNIIKHFIKNKTTSLLAAAAKMENEDVLLLASKMDKTYGKGSKQGDKLRNLVKARQRHFDPFST